MAIVTEGIMEEFTVIVTPEEVTVAGLAQVALEVIVQVIISPFARVVEV